MTIMLWSHFAPEKCLAGCILRLQYTDSLSLGSYLFEESTYIDLSLLHPIQQESTFELSTQSLILENYSGLVMIRPFSISQSNKNSLTMALQTTSEQEKPRRESSPSVYYVCSSSSQIKLLCRLRMSNVSLVDDLTLDQPNV